MGIALSRCTAKRENMNIFAALLLGAVVLLVCAWICHETGKKTAAKWLLGLGIGALWLLWALVKAIFGWMKDAEKRRRND